MKCDKCGGSMTPCTLLVSTVWDCRACEGYKEAMEVLHCSATGLVGWLPDFNKTVPIVRSKPQTQAQPSSPTTQPPSTDGDGAKQTIVNGSSINLPVSWHVYPG